MTWPSAPEAARPSSPCSHRRRRPRHPPSPRRGCRRSCVRRQYVVRPLHPDVVLRQLRCDRVRHRHPGGERNPASCRRVERQSAQKHGDGQGRARRGDPAAVEAASARGLVARHDGRQMRPTDDIPRVRTKIGVRRPGSLPHLESRDDRMRQREVHAHTSSSSTSSSSSSSSSRIAPTSWACHRSHSFMSPSTAAWNFSVATPCVVSPK